MANEPRQGKYLTRENYREATYSQFNDLKNIGYDWRSNVFDRTISPYILSDSKRRDILTEMKKFVVYVMDYASNIKKAFNYTVDKNYKYLN
jgi:hypothetical protein